MNCAEKILFEYAAYNMRHSPLDFVDYCATVLNYTWPESFMMWEDIRNEYEN